MSLAVYNDKGHGRGVLTKNATAHDNVNEALGLEISFREVNFVTKIEFYMVVKRVKKNKNKPNFLGFVERLCK